jgi:hypothetical protein
MIGFHGAEPAAVAKVYDPTGVKKLVDAGGGTRADREGVRGVLGKAGYELARVVPTESAVSIIEARPA